MAWLQERTHVQLRIRPPRNNQRKGIKWVDEFAFEATLGRPGAVAQLGERESGTLEVTGSIPVGSIDISSARSGRLDIGHLEVLGSPSH
jgi:hypothetical protein